jgi:pseudaminic acid cytidylyltransferase
MNLAIIPARGGSKRIPRKNIKAFGGKPMIAYAITAAKNSGLFDHVLVSTDDAEIAKISNEWGAETPFERPAELANDFTATVPVIAHSIHACEALGWKFSNVCCIYPGVPFIEVCDLQRGLDTLIKSGFDYSFPVTEFPVPIQQALKKQINGQMQPIYPENEFMRTQDLEVAFYDVGQFYWGKKQAWLSNNRILGSGVGFDIPSWRVVDIDTPADWDRAEHLALALEAR